MSFTSPKTNKLQGGLGRRAANTDGVFGLIMGGVATVDCPLLTIKKLIQTTDAEDLGLDAAYDAANDVLVHYHISEYFRLHPNGTLFIMLVAQKTLAGGVSMTAMCDIANVNYLWKLFTDDETRGVIKGAGVVLNPDLATYVSTLTTGLDADVLTAIPKAQEMVDLLRTDYNIFIDNIILEGREFNGTIANAKDLRTMASENIQVVIAADPLIQALDASYAKHAAVGTALGSLSIRKVSESLGSVEIANLPDGKKGDESYPLTDVANSLWLKANLSSGAAYSSLTKTERVALTDKGYIYAGFYEGYDGIFFNSSSTCTAIDGDYAFAEYNRTWNKAARYVRQALIVKNNSEVDIDANTGYIKPTTIASWDTKIESKIKNMRKDEEVSAVSYYIDPAQNVNGGAPIVVRISVTPKGIAREIVSDIGFINSFK